MIEEKKKDNENFENYSAAIRYYVHIGIDAENDGDKLTHTFKDRVVARAFGSMFAGLLKPLLNKIGVVQSLLENLTAQTKKDFSYNQTQFTKIIDQMSADVATALTKQNLIEDNNQNYDRHLLKNLLVMRVLTYVMLLGVKARNYNNKFWIDTIAFTEKKLSNISIDKFAAMEPDEFDQEVKILTRYVYNELQKESDLQSQLNENIINPDLED